MKPPDLRYIKGGRDDEPPPPEKGDPGPGESSAVDDDATTAVINDHRRRTDLANGEIFMRRNGMDLRYCYEREAWLSWVGSRWSWDDAKREIEERSAKTVSKELCDAVTSGAGKALLGWTRQSCSNAKRYAMVEACRHTVSVSVDQLDSDQSLVNTTTGTVDVGKGIELQHSRDSLITHVAGAGYLTKSTAPRWEKFIDEITKGSKSLAAYLQRAAGYSITGITTEQCLFVCIGGGANGKGVFLRGLSTAMGTYAKTISAELLLAGKGLHNKRPELAELVGVRLAVANEPEGKAELDEALIKVLTGGDSVVAERKFERPFAFRPRCKIWLACNKAPRFQSGGFSMDRRIRVVPFRRTFIGDDRDDSLDETLEAETDGILLWVIDGAREWMRSGLRSCPDVDAATEEFRGDANPISRWVTERLQDSNSKPWPSVTDLYKDYKDWTENEGDKPLGTSRFRDMIKAQGFETILDRRRLHVVGKKLADPPPDEEPVDKYENGSFNEEGFRWDEYGEERDRWTD